MTLKKAKTLVNGALDTTEKKVTKPLVDLLLGKTMSRKLQVLILATWLVKIDKISGDAWMFIALLYVLGILWLNHVQSMAKLGKSWTGKDSEHGAGRRFGHKFGHKYGKKDEDDKPIETEVIPEKD